MLYYTVENEYQTAVFKLSTQLDNLDGNRVLCNFIIVHLYYRIIMNQRGVGASCVSAQVLTAVDNMRRYNAKIFL